MHVRGWLAAGTTPRTSKRRVVPSCERLEGLTLLSAANPVISGVVFVDRAGTGLFQPGDGPVAGSNLQLLNASGRVIGTATTDANGAYAFSADASRPADAQSVGQQLVLTPTYTDVKNAPLGTISEVFDTSKVRLVDVRVTVSVSTYSVLQAENTSQTQGSDVRGSVSGGYQIDGLPRSIAGALNGATPVFHAATSDGVTDFGGPSGVTFPTVTATDAQTLTFSSPADLAFFASGHAFTPTVSISSAATTGATNGNTVYQAFTKGAAVFNITYDYLTTDSLQPGQYTVVQSPSTPNNADGKASQNGIVVASPGSPQRLAVNLNGGDSFGNNFGKLIAGAPTPGNASQSVAQAQTVSTPVGGSTHVKGQKPVQVHTGHPRPAQGHHPVVKTHGAGRHG